MQKKKLMMSGPSLKKQWINQLNEKQIFIKQKVSLLKINRMRDITKANIGAMDKVPRLNLINSQKK